MSGRLFTDKLVFRWLEGFGAWSLDSATHNILLATSAYLAHASGLSDPHCLHWIYLSRIENWLPRLNFVVCGVV
jgi:hypothetical protein